MIMFYRKLPLGVFITILLLSSCRNNSIDKQQTIFSRLSETESGIHFNNVIKENDSVNIINNEYTYMGGGVGIIDINNDGLQDIFFTGNQTTCRLFLNEANHHFKDITTEAGLITHQWCTGVSIVDINQDGYQDIYVCVSGSQVASERRNLLFLNNKNGTFKESAEQYGLADTGFSTQAVFFDMDKDGDLDMYLVNHLLHGPNPNNIVAQDLSGNSPLNDRLYLNEGTTKNGHPYYKDISMAAGIKDNGYGLGAVVSDFNEDGWPDIYVTDDYLSNDLLWINNKNGTFTNMIGRSTGHQSYSSMGVDAADLNNDGLPDIVTLDMQPELNTRKKEMFSFLTYERYEMERQAGYEPEFMRNMLQLNLGNRQIHDTTMPVFSEIGQLAGMSETDWSWSVLLADFDNDGWKDMHITNGMGRDLINGDFVSYRSQTPYDPSISEFERSQKLIDEMTRLGPVPLQNYLFHNNHDYTFSNLHSSSGIEELSISNGAAYVDLDNDGDLDLVVNNINQPASIYINNTRNGKQADTLHNFLSIELLDNEKKLNSFGAKLYITTSAGTQLYEQNPVRGYASTVDKRIFAGLGKAKTADVKIVWPDGRLTSVRDMKANQFLKLYRDSSVTNSMTEELRPGKIFTDISSTNGLVFKHNETFFNDYQFQRLLPQKYSQLGPFLSVADVNGDGLQDFFIGGAYKQSGKIFIQRANGEFTSKNLVADEKYEEDMGSVFFDANGDSFPDLFVASGSTEFDEGSKFYRPRLYLNDGKGNFHMDSTAIPPSINTIAQATTALDIDGDGDSDLIVAGRIATQFPAPPETFILRNDKGLFHDVTNEVCPELKRAGMITSLVATDFDNDRKMDLIITGEWMPVRFFKNMGGRFTEVTAQTGLTNNKGMWRSLAAADIDGDGDMDIVAGNMGLNNKYHLAEGLPMVLFAKDIDQNGSLDPIIGYYLKDDQLVTHLTPSIPLNQLAEQIPSIRKRYLLYRDYANATMEDIFRPGDTEENIIRLYCEEAASCWFENTSNGKFTKHRLPIEAQFAPVNTLLCTDINDDGKIDVLLSGNEFQTEPMTGRYDASYGLLLMGNGKGFSASRNKDNGLWLLGDVRDMTLIKGNMKKWILLAAANNGILQAFMINK